MNNSELIKIWMGQQAIPAEKLIQASGLCVPTSWNGQQAIVNFAQNVSGILFGLELQLGTDTMILGLTQSVECTDLQLLAANVGSLADELLLAAFEAQNASLLQSLGQLFGKQPQPKAIVPCQDAAWQQALPFTIILTNDNAVVANGYLTIPPSVLPHVAKIDYLSLRDTSVISQEACPARICISHFQLSPDETMETGDYLLIPEITEGDAPCPVTLLFDNGLTMNAELNGTQVQLKRLLDTSPVRQNDMVISLGTVSVHFNDILNAYSENAVMLSFTQCSDVWQNNKIVATGHITKLYDSTALEIETTVR